MRHTHKYIRASLRFAKVWRCASPDCTHFMPPQHEPLMEGRSSFCWGCGEKFVLDEEALKEDMPQCFGCRVPQYMNKDEFIETLRRKREKIIQDVNAMDIKLNEEKDEIEVIEDE